jgi:membrane protease YdiL (CAAX protease family)
MIERSFILSRDTTRLNYLSWKIASLYLVLIAFAEVLTILVTALFGMILYGMIFVVLLVHAALGAGRTGYRFLVVLALIPLIRLLSLTLPLGQFNSIYWYLVIGVPLSFAAYLAARFTGLTYRSIGLCLSLRSLPIQLLLGATGFLLGYIEYLILTPDPMLLDGRLETFLISALIFLVFTGFLEEIIFRGMMQLSAVQYLGRFGFLFTAMLFAILHLGYRSLYDILFVFMVAFGYGIFSYQTGSIIGVSISHGLTNISLYLIYPIILRTTNF